jgi:hypothetical protein
MRAGCQQLKRNKYYTIVRFELATLRIWPSMSNGPGRLYPENEKTCGNSNKTDL